MYPLSDLRKFTSALRVPGPRCLLASTQPAALSAELDPALSAVPRGEAVPRKLLDSSTAPASEAESVVAALAAEAGVLCMDPVSAVKRLLCVHMGRTRVGTLQCKDPLPQFQDASSP